MTLGDKDMETLNLPSVIPVDEDYSRYREVDLEEDSSSAYSIASSAYNFRVENGRRYHDYKEGHPFPHDEVSEENEMVMHTMVLCLLDNKWYLSPIDEASLRNVADVGTGLGLWAEGMADRYPHANIVGIDTAPHERGTHPNCSYMIADATEEWVLDDPSVKFDLVYIRSLFVGVTNWPALYRQCFENMTSDGWIEQLEVEIDPLCDDQTADPNSEIKSLVNLTTEMSVRAGRDFHISRSMKAMIEAAGFVDVQEQRLKLPLGHWSTDPKYREVGKFFERFYKTGLQGWLMQICTRYLGWTVDQVNAACVRAFQEINERKQHYYFNMIIVIGRKP